MAKHLVIPDSQVKHGEKLDYLRWIGEYMVEKQPETVIHLGDFADMESLSSYDAGKKSFEGRRYTKDIKAAREAMDTLLGPLTEYNQRQKKNKEKQYKPRLVLTLGNHEHRIARAVNNDPKLEGLISYADLPYEAWAVLLLQLLRWYQKCICPVFKDTNKVGKWLMASVLTAALLLALSQVVATSTTKVI
jgi:hypothetical protein